MFEIKSKEEIREKSKDYLYCGDFEEGLCDFCEALYNVNEWLDNRISNKELKNALNRIDHSTIHVWFGITTEEYVRGD